MFIPRICQTLYLSTHLPIKQINKIANKITRIWKTRQDTGCLGLVHWDDPAGWDGESGGSGVQGGEHMNPVADSDMNPVADSCQCMAKPLQYCN